MHEWVSMSPDTTRRIPIEDMLHRVDSTRNRIDSRVSLHTRNGMRIASERATALRVNACCAAAFSNLSDTYTCIGSGGKLQPDASCVMASNLC
jgi:hypothetical protein